MKKLKLLPILLMMCFSMTAHAQWEKIQSVTSESLSAILFVDSLTGYAVGTKGVIVKSIDGGDKWFTVHSNDSLILFAIKNQGKDTLIVLGKDNGINKLVFLYSFSAGQNWQKINVPFTLNPNSLHPSIVMFDSLIYFNVNDSLYQYDFNKFQMIKNEVVAFDFVDKDIGYILIEGQEGFEIFKTGDAGKNWIFESIPAQGLLNRMNLKMDYTSTAQACISFDYGTGITCTSDSGRSWTFNSISSIYDFFILDQNVYVIGENGEFNFSGSMGNSWSSTKIDSLKDTPWSIYFVNNELGFICGSNGMILRTKNAGGVGINEISPLGKKIKIYPNPSKGTIHIQCESTINFTSLILLDSQGKQLKKFNRKKRVLDTSGLSPGIYFLQLNTKEDSMSKKILIE